MLKMTLSQILQIRSEIDHIKEYVNSEICNKCEEMRTRLEDCEKLLKKLDNEHTGE